jgi:hypothetical protein
MNRLAFNSTMPVGSVLFEMIMSVNKLPVRYVPRTWKKYAIKL